MNADLLVGPLGPQDNPQIHWGRVKITWSDKSVTFTDPMPYVWCQLDMTLCTDGMKMREDGWIVRPVASIIIDLGWAPADADMTHGRPEVSADDVSNVMQRGLGALADERMN